MKFALALAGVLLVPLSAAAQNGVTSVAARTGIDAGNQAWIDGIKSGDLARIVATYADDAVDCGPTGECFAGKSAIERHMKSQLAGLGRAQSASVRSIGSTRQGKFVYEWGEAEATFRGAKLVERYLTAWEEQSDGSWKIFRNLVIP